MSKIYILVLILIISSLDVISAWKKNTSMPLEYQDVVYLDVYFLPENPLYGWICGYEGRTLRTTDGGKNWLGSRLFNQNNFPIQVQLESIQFLNENIGFTSGPLNSDGFGVIYKSTNGGESWFNVTPPNAGDLWGLYFLDENIGLVIGGGCGTPQYFWRTENGGQNWSASIYNNPGSKMADALLYDKDGLGYAIGSGTLWKSTNGGKSWLPISNTGNVDWHEEITRVNNTFLIPYSEGCFGNTTTDVGGIRITNNEGRTWFQYSTGVPMFGTFLFDESHGWAAGFNRTVIYTSDGGRTWSQQNCGISPGASMDDIWFINDTTGWVVGNGVYEYFVPDADPPTILSEKGFIICPGDSIILTASDGYDAYIWSDGQNSKSITIKSEGKFAVRGIIDSICYDAMSEFVEVKFFEKNVPQFLLSSGNQPCEGDTVEISLKDKYLEYEWQDGTKDSTIFVTESGTYSVSLIDTNGCEVIDNFTVNFQANPDPRILSSRRTSFCVGDSTVLYSTLEYSKYYWYKTNPDSLVGSTRELQVTQSGDYYLVVENSAGCTGISDKIKIIVRDEKDVLELSLIDNFLSLDSAYYSQLNCRMLKIKNNGLRDFSLQDVYIFRNISFSTPQSQFPILIEPGATIELKFCFSPEKLGDNLDSLILNDICNDKLVQLYGFGINESFEDLTKCDVPLEFELTNLSGQKFSFGLSTAVPNPASDFINFKFSALNNFDLTRDLKIKIFNTLGKISEVDYQVFTTSSYDQIANGEIILHTGELLSGLYVIYVELYGQIITEKFTVFR